MVTTHHSRKRIQQRGIPPLVLDLLMTYGRRHHDHKGAEIIYFDKEAKREVASYAGKIIGKLNEYLDAYAVMGDGVLITTGHLYKKICR